MNSNEDQTACIAQAAATAIATPNFKPLTPATLPSLDVVVSVRSLTLVVIIVISLVVFCNKG